MTNRRNSSRRATPGLPRITTDFGTEKANPARGVKLRELRRLFGFSETSMRQHAARRFADDASLRKAVRLVAMDREMPIAEAAAMKPVIAPVLDFQFRM